MAKCQATVDKSQVIRCKSLSQVTCYP